MMKKQAIAAGLAAVLLLSLTAALAISFMTLAKSRPGEPAAMAPTPIASPTSPETSAYLQVVSRDILFEDPKADYAFQGWSADGNTLLFLKNTGGTTQRIPVADTKSERGFFIFELWTYSLQSRTFTKLLENVQQAFYSPDGREIFYSTVSANSRTVDINVIATDGTNRRRLAGGDALAGGSFAVLNDGSLGFVRNLAVLVRRPDGREVPTPNAFLSGLDSGAFSVAPDGSAVVIADRDAVQLYKGNGTRLTLLSNPPGGLSRNSFRWSPDSKKILFFPLHFKAEMKVYDAITGAATTLLKPTSDREEFAPYFWSRDGSAIFFSRYMYRSGIPSSAWVMNPDGSGLRKLTDDASLYAQSAQSADGTKLLAVGGGARRAYALLSLK